MRCGTDPVVVLQKYCPINSQVREEIRYLLVKGTILTRDKLNIRPFCYPEFNRLLNSVFCMARFLVSDKASAGYGYPARYLIRYLTSYLVRKTKNMFFFCFVFRCGHIHSFLLFFLIEIRIETSQT